MIVELDPDSESFRAVYRLLDTAFALLTRCSSELVRRQMTAAYVRIATTVNSADADLDCCLVDDVDLNLLRCITTQELLRLGLERCSAPTAESSS